MSDSEQRKTNGRITFNLIERSKDELERMSQASGFSKTDLINRSISLYAFIIEELGEGKELLFRDSKSGEVERVRIL